MCPEPGARCPVPRAQSPRRGPSDLDEAGEAQAEWGVHWHSATLDLIPIQAEHLQLGEVHDVHHRAEAADGELWRDKKGGRVGETQLRKQIQNGHRRPL